MDVIHNQYEPNTDYDFYGSPTTGVNIIYTKFIPVVGDGGEIHNRYTGVDIIENDYYPA